MSIALVTGSAGLIGSSAVKFFTSKGLKVIGIDNDMRGYFFGEAASTINIAKNLTKSLNSYEHFDLDIRNHDELKKIFRKYGASISLIVHTAAQPSHDWAAKEPFTDFTINANGTLNLLELTRETCPEATFIFTSTNKVYGDRPNALPLEESASRWEINKDHKYYEYGIDESMSIDATKHSLFGASKTAADLLVQEYGHYFGINTVCFRGGCLTGPAHAGAELHGFLSYLIRCVVTNKPYTIFGYQGKQVRDNIHCDDLVRAFWAFFKSPRSAAVYNIGGSRFSNCSILEAIEITESVCGQKLDFEVAENNRIGDHIWWISDIRKFQKDYPGWNLTYNMETIISEIVEALTQRT